MSRAKREGFRIGLDLRLKGAGGRAFGPGRAELLERIDRLGSISAAAREMGMSYRHAWLLLEYTNRAFGVRVVDTIQGGSRGGGAVLTTPGRRILRIYGRMLRDAERIFRDELAALSDLARRPAD